MIFTLHRYIFKDLIKTFLLATLVLSLVLSLGAMLRPLRDFSIDPLRVPELLLYTLPVTLTMVIPVGALLATTLAYGKLAFFNEITACRASGISMRALLYPALTLALLVGVITLLLGFHVLPDFIQRSESLIEDDAEAIIYRNIEKRGNLGNLYKGLMVHADRTDPARHLLSGVVFIRKDRDEIKEIATAEHVFLNIESGGDGQEPRIALRLINARGIREGQGINLDDYTTYIQMPRMYQDEIKFKELGALKEIRQDMTRFKPIRILVKRYRQQVLTEMFYDWIDRQLTSAGTLKLLAGDPENPDQIVIKSGGCQIRQTNKKSFDYNKEDPPGRPALGDLVVSDDQSIRMAWYPAGESKPSRYYKASGANLRIEWGTKPPTAILRMDKVEKTVKSDTRPVREEFDFVYRIQIPGELLQKAELISLNDIVTSPTEETPQAHMSGFLSGMGQFILKECRKLGAEITAELHSRLAFGVCCVVLTLMGAGLGMVFRSSHLLTAFGISFIPTALCLITIFTGKHLAEQNIDKMGFGLAFLWAGIVIVTAIDSLLYRKLTRI